MKRQIAFEGLHNFRDLGGHATSDGRTVAWGRLYRSDSLSKLHGADLERFRGLGVRTVIDLRYPWEIEARGRVPHHEGLRYHNLSIEHRPYDQAALDPGTPVGPYLAERYSEVAHDGTAELRQALDVIAADDNAPVVFHCASGKDRTGLLAALVLGLLGVDDDTIAADFALTEAATERLVADWRAQNPDRQLVWPGYGRAPAEIIRLFLAELNGRYGSVRGYAVRQLGVDDELIGALRRALLAG